jgi:hypothetical protein
MAAGTHTHPFGTQLGYCLTSNGTYTYFSDLIDTQIPDDEWGKSDNSDLYNARQELTTFSWLKATSSDHTLYFVQSVYATIMAIMAAGSSPLYYWEVQYPLIGVQSTPAMAVWAGWISKRSQNKIEKLSDDKYRVVWTIEKQGGVVLTAGS